MVGVLAGLSFCVDRSTSLPNAGLLLLLLLYSPVSFSSSSAILAGRFDSIRLDSCLGDVRSTMLFLSSRGSFRPFGTMRSVNSPPIRFAESRNSFLLADVVRQCYCSRGSLFRKAMRSSSSPLNVSPLRYRNSNAGAASALLV